MTANRIFQTKARSLLCLFGASLILHFYSEPACAADPTPTPTPPKVTKVEGELELHSLLTVTCDGLKEWAQAKGNDPAKLILYLDGTATKGLPPKTDKVNDGILYYRLERISGSDSSKDDNHQAWDALFSGDKWMGMVRNVRVTVGAEGGAPFESSGTTTLRPIPTWWFLGWVAFSAALLICIWVMGKKSDLLRDSGDPPAGGKKPYSLARCQMAFWFFFVVVAYLFIFMVTGATDTITASVLGLMGISAATGLVAVAVDNSKRTQAKTELDQLEIENAKLVAKKTALIPPATLSPEDQSRLNNLATLIPKQQNLVNPSKSDGFVRDLLTDGDGVSFHRLQIAVWTAVLGIIFCVSVWKILSMPTFSATLLGLMGISGGTYVGFKIPEKLS